MAGGESGEKRSSFWFPFKVGEKIPFCALIGVMQYGAKNYCFFLDEGMITCLWVDMRAGT